MAERIDVVLECDFCETQKKVETHTHTMDGGETIEVESCPKCWKPFREMNTRLRAAGRVVPKPKKKRKSRALAKAS
ncbi:hypothetical protein [Paenarthrobacter sp. C1]|uniref:hypothetical protein n=1 Tax=Paenarthrobacter sp. C1 TaxID=3400220 RepID=UPI003BF5F99B